MTRVATSEDYHTLNLPPDTTAEEAKRAYHRMKALYSQGALATYSLLEEDQRGEILDRIERAYMRISQDLRSGTTATPVVLPMEDLDHPSVPGPDQKVGPYLRQRREALGYTLKEVAKKTRIRSTYLEHIEEEVFQNLPAPVYLRGFVIEYARLLGLPEPERIAAALVRQAHEGKE